MVVGCDDVKIFQLFFILMLILLSQSRLFWVAPDGWVVYREKKLRYLYYTLQTLNVARLLNLMINVSVSLVWRCADLDAIRLARRIWVPLDTNQRERGMCTRKILTKRLNTYNREERKNNIWAWLKNKRAPFFLSFFLFLFSVAVCVSSPIWQMIPLSPHFYLLYPSSCRLYLCASVAIVPVPEHQQPTHAAIHSTTTTTTTTLIYCYTVSWKKRFA